MENLAPSRNHILHGTDSPDKMRQQIGAQGLSLTDNMGRNCQSTGNGSRVEACAQPAGMSVLSPHAANDAGSLLEDLLSLLLALLTFPDTRRRPVFDTIYTYDTSALSPLITAFPPPHQTHTSGTSHHYDYNTNPCIYGETGDSTLSSLNYDTPPCTFSATFKSTSSNAPTPTTECHYAATSRHYYGYRLYSPEMGRWLNRDPIGEEGFWTTRAHLEKLSSRKRLKKWACAPLLLFLDNNAFNSVDAFGLSISIVWPSPPPPADPPKGVLVCMGAIVKAFITAETFPKDGDAEIAHCETSCKLANACGENMADAIGILKEANDVLLHSIIEAIKNALGLKSYDEAVAVLNGWLDDSANDFTNNFKGHKCAASGKDCSECCKKCVE